MIIKVEVNVNGYSVYFGHELVTVFVGYGLSQQLHAVVVTLCHKTSSVTVEFVLNL